MAMERKSVKGILKTSTSFDKDGVQDPNRKEMKWDEMNILATYHPADKDYGHTKIDEPPTPYNRMEGEDLDEAEEMDGLDPSHLASRLENCTGPTVVEEESSEEEEDLTEEEKAEKRKFEQKRSKHYNEFQAIKLARQLMEEEEDEDEDDDSKAASSSQTQTNDSPMQE